MACGLDLEGDVGGGSSLLYAIASSRSFKALTKTSNLTEATS